MNAPRYGPRVAGRATRGIAPGRSQRPFRDSPFLILLGIVLFLAALLGLLRVADRSTELAPDYLSEVVLYALSGACFTMLVVLGFILARNIIKLWVERRRAMPFARFRAKLVAALLGMMLIPALLVLFVGSELIRSSAERWFSAPVDDVPDVGQRDRPRLLPESRADRE